MNEKESADRAIGRLIGAVEALSNAISRVEGDGKKGRARIYEELENVRSATAEIRRDVGELRAKIDGFDPDISYIRRWKERFIGMQMLVVFLAGSAGAAITTFWKWLSVKIGVQ